MWSTNIYCTLRLRTKVVLSWWILTFTFSVSNVMVISGIYIPILKMSFSTDLQKLKITVLVSYMNFVFSAQCLVVLLLIIHINHETAKLKVKIYIFYLKILNFYYITFTLKIKVLNVFSSKIENVSVNEKNCNFFLYYFLSQNLLIKS